MIFGQAILPVGRPLVPAIIQTLGPRQAMAETLAEYLRAQTFRVWGDLAQDTEFQLNEIFPEWPDVSQALPYPCASVVELVDTAYEAHNFTPTPIESTLGEFDCPLTGDPNTVLWKVAEAVVQFQVDFWNSNIPEREAIEAQLGHIFNPGERRSGVLIQGPKRYFDRPMRATLMSHRRIDIEGTVYPNERRLQTVVRCEIDVVHLRKATLLSPSLSTEVTDPNDPGDN